MPVVCMEPAAQRGVWTGSIAHAIGIDNLDPFREGENGISEETVIVYEPIPLKYLKRLK